MPNPLDPPTDLESAVGPPRYSELEELTTLLRDPPDALVEQWSRSTSPSIWRRIDEHAAEDGWNGGTALNLKRTIMREDREALKKLSGAIELWSIA